MTAVTAPNSPTAKEAGHTPTPTLSVREHPTCSVRYVMEDGVELATCYGDPEAVTANRIIAALTAVNAHSALLSRLAALEGALEKWSYIGELQTFESRERFRKEAAALLEPRPTAPVTEITAQEAAEIQCGAIGHTFIGGGDEQVECILCGART